MYVKIGVLALLLTLFSEVAAGENPLAQQRQLELGLGFTAPLLQGGTELMRARDIRSDGLSYYQGGDGNRRNVGRYPAPLGFSLNIGFHAPIQRVRGLMLGPVARVALTGSQPRQGGYDEGYFFNSVTLGIGGKYYPSARSNVFLRGEAGAGTVLTKNRFLDGAGNQRHFHQFGIGPAAAVGVGYSLKPFRNRDALLDLQAVYQQLHTRVEVDGIGNDYWRSGALKVVASLAF